MRTTHGRTWAWISAMALFVGAASDMAAQSPQAPPSAREDLLDLSLEDLLDTRIEVSSTGGENLLGTSSVVTVIDRQMIDQFSFRSVAEVLQTLAGISIGRSHLLQGMITTRGLLQEVYDNKNLVLIDGVPTWHAVTGESRAERVDINDVERIEVLKGPGSILYGSQAFTSAINIVTRTAAPGTQDANAYLTGGIGTARGMGVNYHSTTTGGLSVSVSANRNRGQRVDLAFLDESGRMGNVRDYRDVTGLGAKMGYRGHTLSVNAYDVELASFGPNLSFAGGAGTPGLNNGVLAAYQFDRAFSQRSNLVTRVFYDSAYREFSRDNTNTVYAIVRGSRAGATARLSQALSKYLTAEAGADFERRHGAEATSRLRETDALLDGFVDKNVNESSVFAQLDWKPRAWHVVGGARLTSNSLFGNNLALRGTVGYNLGAHRAVKLVAGQSYRSPTLFELFTASPQISGNPAIRPETSNSVELVYQHTRGGLYFQAVGYWAQYDSKISRERGRPPAGAPNPAAPAYYINGHAFRSTGLEAEVRYVSAKLGTYFLNADHVTGSRGDLIVEQPSGYNYYNFRYVPRYNLSVGAFKRYRQFGASAVASHTPKAGGAFAPVGAWTDVALNGFFEHQAKGVTMRHTVSGRNVLDANVAVPEFARHRANVNELPVSVAPGLTYGFSVAF